MYCPKCGSPNEKTAKFCIKCGERLPVSEQPEVKVPVPTPPRDTQQRPGPARPQPGVPSKAKSRSKLAIVMPIVILVLLLILAAELVLLLMGRPEQTPTPATAETAPTIGTGQPEATISSAPTAAPSAGETQSPVPTEADTIDSNACSAENWSFLPTGFYEYPSRDGWKIIVIEFSVQNNTPYWARVATSKKDSQVTTDAGFVYEGISPQFLHVPYPIDFYTSNYIETPLMPPGFSASGNGYGNQFYTYRGDHHFHFIFEVAESSRSYDFVFKGGWVSCTVEWGYFSLKGLAVHVDPQNLTLPPKYPFDGQFEGIPDISLSDPISVDSGIITFTGMGRGEDSLILRYEFENLDQGYDAGGHLDSYVIGIDGMVRAGSGEPYRAGPGQKYQDGVISFPVPSDLGDLYLIINSEHVIYLADNR